MSFFDFLKPKRNPVHEHSKLIFQLAVEAGDATRKFLKESDEELNSQAWIGVVMEYHNLYLQLTDRMIFGRIPETERQVPMSVLAGLCIDAAWARYVRVGEMNASLISRKSAWITIRNLFSIMECANNFFQRGGKALAGR